MDPIADPNNPYFRTEELISALWGSDASKLFNRLINSFILWAIREENRKKLKEITSKTISFLTVSILALHFAGCPALPAAGTVREKPMKIAMVKSEFTFTIPSRAVTWTLVFLDFTAVEGCVVVGFWVTDETFDCVSLLFSNGGKFYNRISITHS